MNLSGSTFILCNLSRRLLRKYKSTAPAIGLIAFILVALIFPAAGIAHSTREPSLPTKLNSPRAGQVATSEDFQASLDAARPGDVITLEAGAVLKGNFRLPKKSEPGGESGWITIQSSAIDELPPEGTRVTPAHEGAMVKLVSPNAQPALMTAPGAHHYRFVGVEMTIAPDVMLNYGIVRLGEGNEKDVDLLPHHLVFDRCYIHGHPMADVMRGIALNSAATDVINSYISDCHGIGFETQAIGGWNGPGPFEIINNYLEGAGVNVMFGGADPRIAGLVPTDIKFLYNHCAKPLSWKEGILARPKNVTAVGSSAFGSLTSGATYYYRISGRGRAGYSTTATSAASEEIAVTLAAGQTSANITWNTVDRATEYRVYRTSDDPTMEHRNWVYYKTASTAFDDTGDSMTAGDGSPPETGTRWSVKNLFELKNARQVLIDGNVFENNWVDAQSGFAIQITVRNQEGTAPWCVIEDVRFSNNIVRHSAGGVALLGRDYLHPSEQLKRVDIINNLFDDIGGSKWGSNGRFLQLTETVDVKLDHNTVFHTGNVITVSGVPNQRFRFTNNIAPHNAFGIIGDGASSGNVTIDRYFPDRTVKKNVIVGANSARYPMKNFYPATFDSIGFVDRTRGNYRLVETSPYKRAGMKGKDIGADMDEIEKATRRALEGSQQDESR
jgi:hypothetical protein